MLLSKKIGEEEEERVRAKQRKKEKEFNKKNYCTDVIGVSNSNAPAFELSTPRVCICISDIYKL